MKTQNALERANSASKSMEAIASVAAGSGSLAGSQLLRASSEGGPAAAPGGHGGLRLSGGPSGGAAAEEGESPSPSASAAGTTGTKISIPQRNLRVLTDPVIDMLTQVHKLMLVAQLPPSLRHDERRQFLQRVHARLFASDQVKTTKKQEEYERERMGTNE